MTIYTLLGLVFYRYNKFYFMGTSTTSSTPTESTPESKLSFRE